MWPWCGVPPERQVLHHFDHFSHIQGHENEWNELLTGVSQRLRSQLLTDTNRELLESPLFVEITKTYTHAVGPERSWA